VVYTPDHYASGEDPQLTKGVELVLERLQSGEIMWRPEGPFSRPVTAPGPP
jgi:hypothetical protein